MDGGCTRSLFSSAARGSAAELTIPPMSQRAQSWVMPSPGNSTRSGRGFAPAACLALASPLQEGLRSPAKRSRSLTLEGRIGGPGIGVESEGSPGTQAACRGIADSMPGVTGALVSLPEPEAVARLATRISIKGGYRRGWQTASRNKKVGPASHTAVRHAVTDSRRDNLIGLRDGG